MNRSPNAAPMRTYPQIPRFHLAQPLINKIKRKGIGATTIHAGVAVKANKIGIQKRAGRVSGVMPTWIAPIASIPHASASDASPAAKSANATTLTKVFIRFDHYALPPPPYSIVTTTLPIAFLLARCLIASPACASGKCSDTNGLILPSL